MLRHVVVLLLFACTGCSTQDADLLSRILQRTGEKLESTAGGSTNQFVGRLRSTAQPTIGLAERVETRLRWDRYLDGVEVQTEATAEGVIRVSGSVPDLAKKQRVLDLSRSTLGVKEVVDELQVPKEEK